MSDFKIITSELISKGIEFEIEGDTLIVGDCSVINYSDVYFLKLFGINTQQGMAVKHPIVIADFLASYYYLLEDHNSITVKDINFKSEVRSNV
ncbi:hypothetical protein NUT44_01780 [Staphylococcus haemolyticus]|uniref:hypothetical protein n=1 Tax=Staphylococcus haemolyticus TaxID=1283 RepID=UPI0021AE23F8|nr:hypothetical protein [Staphylococcus haemolyticus]UUY83518.1 hypothetical protein NUT44_01780 [Staphylococcus haemolyticus]